MSSDFVFHCAGLCGAQLQGKLEEAPADKERASVDVPKDWLVTLDETKREMSLWCPKCKVKVQN